MSDDDRLADYLARIADPEHVRSLPDGCACGLSLVACNAGRYLTRDRCCEGCCHG